MATRKKGKEKRVEIKKKVSRKKTAPKKIEEDSNEPLPAKAIKGKLMWEYRAFYAEWKVAYAEGRLTAEKYRQKVTDTNGQIKPKYKELLDLIALDNSCREEIRRRGAALTAVQQRIADKLGLSLKDFVKNYTFDADTGAVTYIGME